VIAVCCGVTPGFSQTGTYPNRTMRIVVPFVPGGGVDTLARMFAERVQPRLAVTVIVENRAGASGTVGGAGVQQSPSDG
jgi:tripartite-type tricarboxylate transporter receptor subunit TctC